jgi:hypothetical protein
MLGIRGEHDLEPVLVGETADSLWGIGGNADDDRSRIGELSDKG